MGLVIVGAVVLAGLIYWAAFVVSGRGGDG